MLNYPVESDVFLFLKNTVASLKPFADAHSVALTFESDREVLRLSYHPETVASDITQLLCRVVTFTPQHQSVKLQATLIEHIIFFDGAFPKYELTADELTAEGNRVVLRSHLIGTHTGVFGDIEPSYRAVNFPFVVTYTIENRKILSHWLVADQMVLMEQLGIEQAVATH